MIEHHIQRSIVNRLTVSDDIRFSDLKPDDMDNNAFMYHLQKLIKAGLVHKGAGGGYELTEEGRRLGRRLADPSYSLATKPHSVLFLLVRRSSDGAWLLYKRKTHPLKGMTGFMHASPTADYAAAENAERELLEKTGLSGSFSPLGGGFFRIYRSGELESYTQFTLLVCEDATGSLVGENDAAHYWWEPKPDFKSLDMLPNMAILKELYDKGQVFFIDQALQLS